MGIKRFKLLKPILEWEPGYIITVEDDRGWLGFNDQYGWELPLFILESHPTWFEEILT